MIFEHKTHPLLGKRVIWKLHPELGPGGLTYASIDNDKGIVVYGDKPGPDRTLKSNHRMEFVKLSEIEEYVQDIPS